MVVACNKTTKLEVKMIENKPAKVTLKNKNGKYQLFVNNEPFYI